MAWRVANSLNVLRQQVDAGAPGRNTASDGTIGDVNHSPTSDHAPKDFRGWGNDIVTARDITHDPRAGADMDKISEQLRLSRDARIKYVIWRDRMYSSYPSAGRPGWTWRPYSGTFHSHLHVSVVGDQRADDTNPWQIGAAVALDERELNNLHDILWSGGTSMGAAVPAPINPTGFGNSITDLIQHIRQRVDLLVERPTIVQLSEQDRSAIVAELTPAVVSAVLDVVKPTVDAAAEAAVRRVLGEVDGASPADG